MMLTPVPQIRIRPGATGTPVTLADGNEWLLAEFRLGEDSIDTFRDLWFDEAVRSGSVPNEILHAAAFSLLAANYDPLEPDEYHALMTGVDPELLARAVRLALFGDSEIPASSSFSAWARSQLLANGIDPKMVPIADLHNVLTTLVRNERAVPVDEFVQSIRQRDSFESLRARVKKPGQ